MQSVFATRSNLMYSYIKLDLAKNPLWKHSGFFYNSGKSYQLSKNRDELNKLKSKI